MTDRSPTIMVRERVAKTWCLFLDRDGVIDTRIMDGYVRDWTEFDFLPGVLTALGILARWAPHIVVVTNQQGVGKGIMSAADLADIHDRMQRAVAEAGGRIDAIQSCPHLAGDGCACRKPNTGMAEEYLTAHPEIEPSLSVMIGDTDSDIEMGRRLAAVTGGCITVRIDRALDPLADLTFPDLAGFAETVAALLADETGDGGHSAE